MEADTQPGCAGDCSSKPIGAYAILAALGQILAHPKPQTVYRAIDFWLKKGFIHSVKSANGYILCQKDCAHQGFQFMLCNSCGKAIEAPSIDLPQSLKDCMENEGFVPFQWAIEIHGSCSKCKKL